MSTASFEACQEGKLGGRIRGMGDTWQQTERLLLGVWGAGADCSILPTLSGH